MIGAGVPPWAKLLLTLLLSAGRPSFGPPSARKVPVALPWPRKRLGPGGAAESRLKLLVSRVREEAKVGAISFC